MGETTILLEFRLIRSFVGDVFQSRALTTFAHFRIDTANRELSRRIVLLTTATVECLLF
jgi:hypothetical protein